MDRLSRSARRCPRFTLQSTNRALQSRSYTKETLSKLNKRKPGRTTVATGKKLNRSRVGKVEAFGKPREQNSNAAKILRMQESRKVEKALTHEHHGENVYAYAHIRTGQVVYSLTRVMDNTQIMHQLVFHGKKTVPSSLRRDHWTPYFSLHFPSSYSGLLAYHHLRELSLQRQLSPPSELVMTIKQHASKERKKRMTDEEKEEWEQNNEGKPYQDGIARLMDKKSRAKVLMNQKATSVADVAFVVGLMEEEGHLRTPSEVEEAMREKRERRLENAGERRRRTLRRNWKREDGEEYKERAVHAQEGTKWGLERYAARRIAMEYGGVVVDAGVLGKTRVVLPGRDENKGGQEQEEETLTDGETTAVSPTTAGGDVPITTTAPPRDPSNPLAVHIFWSDLRDAAYAATWPGIISHGELARMAVSRVAPGGRRTGRKGLTDAKGGAGYIKDRTVHVIGGVKVGEGEEGWMRGKDWSVATTESRDLRYGDGEKVGGRDGEGEAIESKSREEQIEELKREGVVVDPSSSSSSRRGGGGLFGWVKGRLGMGSSQTSSASTSA